MKHWHRFICRLRGHRLTLDAKGEFANGFWSHRVMRLRCTRCGQCDPYHDF